MIYHVSVQWQMTDSHVFGTPVCNPVDVIHYTQYVNAEGTETKSLQLSHHLWVFCFFTDFANCAYLMHLYSVNFCSNV